MDKGDLVNAIASKAKLSKKDATNAINAFMVAVEESLKKGDKVALVGFGSFDVRKKAAKAGVNPQTREPIKIAARKVPVFKAGKGLKDSLNVKAVKAAASKKK